MSLLDNLNPQQREAVETTRGPVLVLAGAGSGKTRVITYRIAHLIERGTPPQAILAVTFTNKAADQMKERVARLLSPTGRDAGEVWISTFHSFCARLLRREAPRLGLPRWDRGLHRDFAIYDEDDQAAAVKLAIKNLGFEEKTISPRSILERISFAKNHSLSPEQMAAEAQDPRLRDVARLFAAYQQILAAAGALDFDDLLLRAVELLREHPAARHTWSQRFEFLHVDEYQDTNRVQYDLLRLLAGERQNLCVVGDEDQAIYAWRGAEVGNILRFAEDFPGAQVFRLEENYRSKQQILDAAGGVVAHNVQRLGKTLRATRGSGALLRFFEADDAQREAEFVAEEIFNLQRRDPAQTVAVAYRTNAQSRSFEEALRRTNTRYRLLGGFSFYQRAEVRDAVAYVRVAMNPSDDVALLRIVNIPPRGIGPASIEALRALAQRRGTSLWSALEAGLDSGDIAKGVAPLKKFQQLIEGLRAEIKVLPPSQFLQLVLERSGYFDFLEQQRDAQETGRAENLSELVNALAEAEERGETLEEFLDRTALVSDADAYDERAPVTLLTLHTAKGLEFDHVFLTGLEDGLFPHSRALGTPAELEEERRLCYVGMTRARETLTLTRAAWRRTYGNNLTDDVAPSRFLSEIPPDLVETVPGSLSEAGDTRRYVPDPDLDSADNFRRSLRARGIRIRRPAPARYPGASAGNHAGKTDPLIGMRVRHKKYGLGTIIGVDGEGEDRKLTVSFTDYGAKKLVERYAGLERA